MNLIDEIVFYRKKKKNLRDKLAYLENKHVEM